MKKIINSIVFVAVASMIMYSCSTNLELPIETTSLKTLTTADTTIVDCFTPLSDITIYIGEDTITVTSDGDFDEELEDWLTGMEPFSIQFPIDVELADGTTFTLNSMDDLITVLRDCGVDFDVHEEEEDDDDADESDDDADESDDDTDESDDDTDESDDDTDESDDDTDESDDDTDESDDDTDESDDDTDESDDDTNESDDDTDDSDDDTGN